MAAELKSFINELSDYRVSFCKEDFMVVINGYQIFATINKNKYEVVLMKNYNLIRKGTIDKDDVVYFLLYFKNKTV